MKEKIQSIGIDVSKKTLDVCFLSEKFKVLKEFKTSNSIKWAETILDNIKKFKLSETASFVLESTGSYHVFVSLFLKEEWYLVKVFNPILSSKYSKNSIRKCKTDKVDAKKIAELGLIEDLHELTLTKDLFFLRKKISFLKTLTKQIQVLKASTGQFEEDCENLDWEMWLFYTPMKKSLKDLEKTKKILEKEIEKAGAVFEWFENISNIKWVSKKAASIILSHISDKEFTSKQALIAFAWLDVSTKQSGTSINWRGRISKRWNSMLRKTLVQAAWWLMMHNPVFQILADWYREKWKHYFAVMVIIARKLLNVIYWMLKNNSRFDSAKISIL